MTPNIVFKDKTKSGKTKIVDKKAKENSKKSNFVFCPVASPFNSSPSLPPQL
jgi:hypothetical protein